eukprot:1020890-Pleurochrysis_carterae.AAC.1
MPTLLAPTRLLLVVRIPPHHYVFTNNCDSPVAVSHSDPHDQSHVCPVSSQPRTHFAPAPSPPERERARAASACTYHDPFAIAAVRACASSC